MKRLIVGRRWRGEEDAEMTPCDVRCEVDLGAHVEFDGIERHAVMGFLLRTLKLLFWGIDKVQCQFIQSIKGHFFRFGQQFTDPHVQSNPLGGNDACLQHRDGLL